MTKSARRRKSLLVLLASTSLLAAAACGGGGTGGGDGGGTSDGGGSGSSGSTGDWVAAADLDLSDLGFSSDVEDELRSLYQAAQDNDETTIMMYAANNELRRPLFDAFSERFPGITIEYTELVGAQLQATFEAEKSTGRHIGDYHESPNGAKYADAGYFQPYNPPAFEMPPGLTENLQTQIQDPDHLYTAAQWAMFGVGVNTEHMDVADIPRRWEDFADPQWEGKLVMHDPTVPGGGNGILTRLSASGSIDEETLAGIAQNVALKGDFGQVHQSLAQGEYPVMLAMDSPSTVVNKAQGVPIEIVFMEENNVAMAQQMSILEGAPHPNATKLWMNWSFSQEAQALMAEQGNTPITEVESPHGLPTFENANLADLPTQDVLDAETPGLTDLYKTLFGR